MRPRAAILAAALALAAPAAAQASADQESILMDDPEIVYAKPEKLDQRMAEIKALGFDRIRVSVYWRLLAPSPDKKERPGSPYSASDPRFYGQSRWDRYDRIVQLAGKHGLGLLFTLTGPSPLWVTGKPTGTRSDVEDTWDPSAADFRDFATAVGRRYSGSWQDERQQPGLLPLLPPTTVKDPPLPRVDRWSIWNEPNHQGWLTPQSQPSGKRMVAAAPRIYRGLVDAGWAGLAASGHGNDVILIGETAPRGHTRVGVMHGIKPLRFIRELYCVDSRMRPFRGAAAEARGCPRTFDAAGFVAAHPGLFSAAGWAHHPYSLTTAPRVRESDPDNATLSGIGRLTRTLDEAFQRYDRTVQLPIHMTEYGYQTNPPDPTVGVSVTRQAEWLGHAAHMAYRNSRIAAFAQFLLVDDAPLRQYPSSDPRHWGTFQTGLIGLDGKRKPAYEAWKRPIDVSPARPRRGGRVRIFGQFRPAADGAPLTADVQFRRRGSKSWARVAQVQANRRGFVLASVTARRSGSYRIAWAGNGASRAVAVRLR